MNYLTKSLLATGLAFVSAVSASGKVIVLSDDFTSYGSTANLSDGSGAYTYTQFFPAAPLLLDTNRGNSGGQSLSSGINANSENRLWINLPGGSIAGTDENPISVAFSVNTDVNLWHTREYIELRSYANGSFDDGALIDLIAFGFNSGGDTSRLHGRVLSGPGWFDLSDAHVTRAEVAASEDWTDLVFLVKTDTVEFYLNGNLDTTVARAAGVEFDSLVIGSGLSTAVEVWFDNLEVSVIPEPSTYAAIFGAFALVGAFIWCRRRA